MQKTHLKTVLSLIVCIALIAALALTTIGCADNTLVNSAPITQTLGEGETSFTFSVVDGNGAETAFTIRTDKKTVGDALTELGLIAGEESQYGLYVKTVNGITVDYDKDGKYWAFYINGEYGTAGADMTDIVKDATYTFKVQK